MMMGILNDHEAISKLDSGGMLDTLARFPENCLHAIEIVKGTPLEELSDRSFNGVVFIGMGGSSIGGRLVRDWLWEESEVPLVVSNGYHVPGHVKEDTLVIAVSYSGNTEETLSSFKEAAEMGASIVAITSGGLLESEAREKGIPVIFLPAGLKPRAALPYLFFSIASTMNRLGLILKSWEEVDEAIRVLKGLRGEIAYDVPSTENLATELASKLVGHVPVVYGSELLSGVAYRFGTQLNENSKVPAFSGFFPELFHNVILSSQAPRETFELLRLVLLRDSAGEDAKMTRRIDRFKELMEPGVSGIEEVRALGTGRLARILSMTYLGDFVSVYLGLLNGVDPSSEDAIAELKRV